MSGYATSDLNFSSSCLCWGHHLRWCIKGSELKSTDEKCAVYRYSSSFQQGLSKETHWFHCGVWLCTGREYGVAAFSNYGSPLQLHGLIPSLSSSSALPYNLLQVRIFFFSIMKTRQDGKFPELLSLKRGHIICLDYRGNLLGQI